jgi:hypothetical protein
MYPFPHKFLYSTIFTSQGSFASNLLQHHKLMLLVTGVSTAVCMTHWQMQPQVCDRRVPYCKQEFQIYNLFKLGHKPVQFHGFECCQPAKIQGICISMCSVVNRKHPDTLARLSHSITMPVQGTLQFMHCETLNHRHATRCWCMNGESSSVPNGSIFIDLCVLAHNNNK